MKSNILQKTLGQEMSKGLQESKETVCQIPKEALMAGTRASATAVQRS